MSGNDLDAALAAVEPLKRRAEAAEADQRTAGKRGIEHDAFGTREG
jgi:hypothetical protein